MDPASLARMLREDRAEWQALVAVLDAHPEGSLHTPGSPEWCARDIFAHLARWIGHSTDELEARLAGRTLPRLEGTDDEINARWQAEDGALTFAEARRRAHVAYERRMRAVEGVPSGRWDPALEAIARADGSAHYAGHRRYIAGSGAIAAP